MINLDVSVYNSIEIRKTNFFIFDDDARVFIGYKYGHKDAAALEFYMDKTHLNAWKYVASYEEFIRVLYLSGVPEIMVSPFVLHYLQCLHSIIKEEELGNSEITFLDIFIIEAIIMAYSVNMDYESIMSLAYPVVNDFILKCKTEGVTFDPWIFFLERYSNSGGANNMVTDITYYEDSLLLKLVLNDRQGFVSEIDSICEASIERARCEENYKSDSLLGRTKGYYDFSFSFLRIGYITLFDRFNQSTK